MVEHRLCMFETLGSIRGTHLSTSHPHPLPTSAERKRQLNQNDILTSLTGHYNSQVGENVNMKIKGDRKRKMIAVRGKCCSRIVLTQDLCLRQAEGNFLLQQQWGPVFCKESLDISNIINGHTI